MNYRHTYVVGDIQGCYNGLRRLLDKAEFSPDLDKLYAVGDLVARGEDSLSTLRFLKSLGNNFSAVLGNHDLHLLAVVNKIRKAKKSDKLQSLLDASDLSELVNWLRQFPLAQRISPHHVIVHAGLFPQWSTDTLLELSQEVSQRLQSDNYAEFLEKMYGNSPATWSSKLKNSERMRFIVNACTRMRFVRNDGSLEFATKSHPSQASKQLLPWFTMNNPYLEPEEHVIFGHWAALNCETKSTRFIGLDSGFVWGQEMSLLRINDNTLIKIAA